MTNAHRTYVFWALAFVAAFAFMAYGSVAQGQGSGWSLTTSSSYVQNGDTVILSIDGTLPDRCTYSGQEQDGTSFSTPNQQITPPYNQTTTYTIDCFGDGSSSVSVKADASGPPPPATATITANPVVITVGDSAVLSWSSTRTSSCRVTNAATDAQIANGTSGSMSVTPDTSTTYRLNCTATAGNSNPSPSDSAIVVVNAPEFDASCRPDVETATVGQTVTWTASASNGVRPYRFSWEGDGGIDSFTGRIAEAVYSSVGLKTASVNVADSSNNSHVNVSSADGTLCTGEFVEQIYNDFHDESNQYGGFSEERAREEILRRAEAVFSNPGIEENFYENPQQYCVQSKITLDSRPTQTESLVSNYRLTVSLYRGTGVRQAGSSDYGSPDSTGWLRTRYLGTTKGQRITSSKSITRLCEVPVEVTDTPPPTVDLTASSPSVTQGATATLTWDSTNATSCTATAGAGFATGGLADGNDDVVPTAPSTLYTVSCSGAGGTATDSVEVAVTIPTITGSCSVSPQEIAAGGTATWTATNVSGGNGTYAYAWSGTDGLTGTTQSVTKQYTIPGTKSASVTITSGQLSRTIPCSNQLSVTGNAPDLIASNVTFDPAEPEVGEVVALSAIITNQGSASTGRGFANFFQRATSAAGANAISVGRDDSSTLAISARDTIAAPHSFPSARTWYVRACADKASAGDVGVIDESNENNNCSPNWTPIHVCPRGEEWNGSECEPDTEELSCNVSDTSVGINESVVYTAEGGSTPYTWRTSTNVTLPNTGRTLTRTYGSAGSYGMSVSKSGYETGNCPVVVVGGGEPDCGDADVEITATPDRVRSGQTTTVTWSATGVDGSCTIYQNNSVLSTVTGNACNVPTTTRTRTITTQTVFRITCDNNEDEDQVIVNLIPEFEEF